jgi:hypothetical protein
LQNNIEELDKELQEKELQHNHFRQWREQGEVIEAEFKVISSN